jgi:carbonic anhydrase
MPVFKPAAICLIPLLGLGLISCGEKDKHASADDHAISGVTKITHWSYEGDTGPQNWAGLGGVSRICATGSRQSPVNITGGKKPLRAPVRLEYQASPATIQNTGLTIDITPQSGGGLINDGVRYDLKNFVFHSPSEHAIDGRKAALEVQFIHQNEAGETLIVSVLSDVGVADPVLASLWTYLPQDPGRALPLSDLLVNAQDLMPSSQDFYVYSGSLTTPPCTEGVTWMVFTSTLSVSPEQADALQRLIGANARPLQAQNRRDYIHLSAQ